MNPFKKLFYSKQKREENIKISTKDPLLEYNSMDGIKHKQNLQEQGYTSLSLTNTGLEYTKKCSRILKKMNYKPPEDNMTGILYLKKKISNANMGFIHAFSTKIQDELCNNLSDALRTELHYDPQKSAIGIRGKTRPFLHIDVIQGATLTASLPLNNNEGTLIIPHKHRDKFNPDADPNQLSVLKITDPADIPTVLPDLYKGDNTSVTVIACSEAKEIGLAGTVHTPPLKKGTEYTALLEGRPEHPRSPRHALLSRLYTTAQARQGMQR